MAELLDAHLALAQPCCCARPHAGGAALVRPGRGGRTTARRLAVPILVAGSLQCAAAATIATDVAHQDDVVVIEASALIDADACVASRVLIDYERYTDFIPGVRRSHVVGRRGPNAH